MTARSKSITARRRRERVNNGYDRPWRDFYLFVLIGLTILCAWGEWDWLGFALSIIAIIVTWVGWRNSAVYIESAISFVTRKLRLSRSIYVMRWNACADNIGLPGSRAVSSKTDKISVTLRIRLRHGQTYHDILKQVQEVESSLAVRPNSVRVWPQENRSDRCYVRIITEDKLAKPIPWPGASIKSVRDPLPIGLYEDQEIITLNMIGGHILIGGMTGSGKSSLLSVIIANLAACSDVVLWGIDRKEGVELTRWDNIFDMLATEEDETPELLEAANRVHNARMVFLRENGQNKWQPNAGDPALFVVIDELAKLDKHSHKLVDHLATQGRASCVQLIMATQRPSREALGSINVRTQVGTRICMRVRESADTNLILGSGSVADGWRAERLGPEGSLLLRASGYSLPRAGRAYWVADPQPPESPLGRLDGLSADAAAPGAGAP